MTPFSVDALRGALGDAVASVRVVETFPASQAEVARLDIRFSDGRPPLVAIGKHASGDGLAAARRAGYALVPGSFAAALLDAVVDTLVGMHARFREDVQRDVLEVARPMSSVTRAVQAWPASVVAASATAVRDAVAGFVADVELTADERGLLLEIGDAWEDQVLARAADGRAITLLHSDFHLLDNVLFGPDASRPRVIDWSELKPGLGPDDLAYWLLSAPHEDRSARDLALLRRYWDGFRRRASRATAGRSAGGTTGSRS